MNSRNINSMGVVISKICRVCPSTTNNNNSIQYKTLKHDDEWKEEPTVVKINLKIILKDVTFPRVDDEYILFLFASVDIQDNPLLNKYINLKPAKIAKTSFCVRVNPNIPYKLHSWLFVNSKDSDGIFTQTLLATGEIKFQDLVSTNKTNSIQLKDIKLNKQATITIACTHSDHLNDYDFASMENQPNRDLLTLGSTSHPLTTHYLNQIYEVYDTVKHEHNQKFAYIDTHCGRIPLLAFPLLATQIRPTKLEANALLDRLFFYSCNHLGLNKNAIIKLPLEMKMELICEMLTLIPRFLIYELDYIRTGKTTTKPVDQWTRLLAFPILGLAAYDCEDGAELILELIHVFKYTKLEPTEQEVLFHLQTLLQSYTPFLTLGLLNEGNGVTPHAYVILLDSNYVNHQILKNSTTTTEIKYNPTCILESTNYTQSVWALNNNNTSDKFTENNNPLPKNLQNEQKWQRMVKFKMPATVVRRENMYGTITALLTADHISPNSNLIAFHSLMCSSRSDSKQPSVGIEIQSLVSFSSDIEARTLMSLNENETNEFQNQLLSEFPPSILPKVVGVRPSRNPTDTSFLMRKLDYDSFYPHPSVKTYPYECVIAADAKLFCVYLPLKPNQDISQNLD
jgi:hypothetical protein